MMRLREETSSAERRAVLVADDENTILTLTARVIVSLDLVPIVVNDGAAAIEVARTHQCSLACALLDVQMPLINGVDAALMIQRVVPDLGIVLMSGAIPPLLSERIREQRLRLVAVLEKPFSLEALRGALLSSVRVNATGSAAYVPQGGF